MGSSSRQSYNFVEETLNKNNYDVSLTGQDIFGIAKMRHGWCRTNGNMLFDVIETMALLKDVLNKFNNPNKPRILILFVDMQMHRWVALIIDRDKNTVYFVDSFGDGLPDLLRNELGMMYENIDVKEFKLKQHENIADCGILALDNAAVIYEALIASSEPKREDFLPSIAEDEEKERRREELINKRKDIARCLKLNCLNIVRRKFKTILEHIKHVNQTPVNNFDYVNANVFLNFLEAVALQDEVLRELDPKFEKYFDNIIDEDDRERVRYIRTELLLHPKRKDYSILVPEDFKKFININDIGELFKIIEKYVESIIEKFDGYRDVINPREVVTPKTFLKSKYKIGKIGTAIALNKLEEYLESFLYAALKEAYKNERTKLLEVRKSIFDLLVNIAPYLENKHKNKSWPGAFKEIKTMRNVQIHEFYKYGDNQAEMAYAYKCFLHNYKGLLFKYTYSLKINGLLKQIIDNDENDQDTQLKNSLNTFKKSIGADKDCNKQVNTENSTKKKVIEYFKFMAVIDNEEAIATRQKNRKTSDEPGRYDDLNTENRLTIYLELQKLQELKISNNNEYTNIKDSLKMVFKDEYGLLENEFKTIVELQALSHDNSIYNHGVIDDVIKTIEILTKCKNADNCSAGCVTQLFKNRKDLTNNEWGSLERKISLLEDGKIWDVKINEVDYKISTDKFVINMFEMMHASNYQDTYNDIEEAFKDDTFLDYLEAFTGEKEYFQKFLNTNLPKYTIPYIARLVAKPENFKNKTITVAIINGVIKKLLEGCYINHLLRLMDKVTSGEIRKDFAGDKQLAAFYKRFCEYLTNPQVNVDYLDVVFENCNHTDSVLNELLNKLHKKSNINVKDLIMNIFKRLIEIGIALKNYKKDYGAALKLLDSDKIKETADKLEEIISKDSKKDDLLIIFDLKFLVTKLGNKINVKDDVKTNILHNNAMILEEIKGKTENLSSELVFLPYYLITFNFIGNTHSLLDKQTQQTTDKPYTYYNNLYNKMLQHVLGNVPIEWDKHTYIRIKQSQKYNEIRRQFPKQLNILRIKTDMAFNLSKLDPDRIENWEESLKIYNEVHEAYTDDKKELEDIKKYLSQIDPGQPANCEEKLKKLKEVLSAYTDNKKEMEIKRKILSEIGPNRPQNFADTLKIYNEVFDSYMMKVECQIIKIKRFISRIYKSIGDAIERIKVDQFGQVLYNYEQAMAFNKEVFDMQRDKYWADHPAVKASLYSLTNIMRKIAFKNIKIGHLKKGQNDAFIYFIKAESLFREILEYQTNDYKPGILTDDFKIKTRMNIAKANYMVGTLMKDRHMATQYLMEAIKENESILEMVGESSAIGIDIKKKLTICENKLRMLSGYRKRHDEYSAGYGGPAKRYRGGATPFFRSPVRYMRGRRFYR